MFGLLDEKWGRNGRKWPQIYYIYVVSVALNAVRIVLSIKSEK